MRTQPAKDRSAGGGSDRIGRRTALKRIALATAGVAAVVTITARPANAYGVTGDYTDDSGYGVASDYSNGGSGYGVNYSDGGYGNAYSDQYGNYLDGGSYGVSYSDNRSNYADAGYDPGYSDNS